MTNHAYVHIPFCLRKCRYCSFVSGFDIKLKDEYIKALKREIEAKYRKEPLNTLYFGGGTPSLLSPEDVFSIVSMFNIAQGAEITLEANPETAAIEKFKEFRHAGINRISCGVQTFDDKILKYIGRKHDEKTIYSAIDTVKSAGFRSISVDLIYGLPFQSEEMFAKDLEKAIGLDVEHISTYGLKIAEKSYFAENPPENLPDDDLQAQMYEMLCKTLNENGFEHYEISNFAKTGFESKHNICYWKNRNYYGFGLNASGYEGNVRYTNTADFEEYIKNPLKTTENRALSRQETLENEIFLALRLKDGVNISEINEKFGVDFEEKYSKIIKKYENTGFVALKNGKYALTEKGFPLSSEIMSEFIEI